MDNPKKILILYASAGHGHEKAAKAILEACQEMPGVTAEAVDALGLATPFYGNLYRQSYLLQIQYAPWLWGSLYYVSDLGWIYGILRLIRRILNALTAKGLEKLILEKKPDAIIATHFLSVEVASHLKETGRISARLISVVTDYLPHHVWIAKKVDRYAVALPETKERLMEWGISAEQIRVTGIPVEKKFNTYLDMQNIRAALCLELKALTALITSGGGGIGSMNNIVKRLLDLKKPLQILAVCGTNRALFQALSAIAAKNEMLKVFGFVNNMQELMAAADLVIGKAGGLTITESFSQGKPLILFESIPGQEARNAQCVKKYGAGFSARSLSEVVMKVAEITVSPDQLKVMKEGARRMFRKDASESIARLAWQES